MPGSSALNSGMALIGIAGDEGEGDKLVVRYLSTGRQVVIAGGNVRHATFSPDGKKAAYLRSDAAYLHTVNIDGTNDTIIATDCGGARGTPQWCSDGYIYWEKGKLLRISENGGTIEDLIGSWRTDLTSPLGDTLEGGLHGITYIQMDSAGRRAIGTAPRKGKGYSQRAYDLEMKEEYYFLSPCIGGMSPSGNLVSVSYSGHRYYRIVPWMVPFVDYGENGNTVQGCRFKGETLGHCPEYDTTLAIADDIQALFSPDTRVDDVGVARFSDHEEDIFLFAVEKGAGSEEAVGCYAFDFTEDEYTKLHSEPSYCWGFIREEIMIDNPNPCKLSPTAASFAVREGAPPPKNQTLTLTSEQAMASPPVINERPDWLSVEANQVSADRYDITLGPKSDGMPGEGDYHSVLQVIPAGSACTLSVNVTLSVTPFEAPPILIHSPVEGASYSVGDTMRVTYSADPTIISGVVISLTTDGGISLKGLNPTETLPAESDKAFEYVIPDSSFVSDNCRIKLSDYPQGYDTFSGRFSIVQSSSISWERSNPSASRLSVASNVNGGDWFGLRISSPYFGIGTLYDISGRLLGRTEIRKGKNSYWADSDLPGSLLLRVSYDNGSLEKALIVNPN